MTCILIVEDEPRIASFIELGLRGAGFTTVTAQTGQAAIDYVRAGTVDLMVLDLGLPDIDGLEVLRRLRGTGDETPVVILTARSEVLDVVAGFDAGAQDYLPKPFAFEELLVRIRARLAGSRAAPSSAHHVTHDDVDLDLRTRRASIEGKGVELSTREFALAVEFLRHPGQVLTRAHLLDTVWGMDFDPGSNVVDVYVRYLRRKFGAERIETVRGLGYRWV